MATTRKAATKKTFSDAELEAMQDAKVERRKGKKADGLADLLAKIAELDESDRAIAETIHELVTENAPGLSPKTWYGMPAWANADGKVVCFLTPAGKFDSRYASFGFNDSAKTLFRSPVSAICVRMVFFYKFLVARLDVGWRRADVKSKGIQRFRLESLQLSVRCLIARRTASPLLDEAKGILDARL